MFLKKIIISILLIIYTIFFGCNFILAANLDDAFRTGSYLDTAADGAGYELEADMAESIISTIIQAVLSFLGVIFLVLMIYGGYLWMTALGNEEQLTKAKNVIIAAVTGLVIVVSAYAISWFVVDKLGTGTLK
ncbi:MAG: hypothetical protein U9R14_00045 [Patescibacteria group bacterium]|nr:hypothetical protein [Patescibacteria group bacterium]